MTTPQAAAVQTADEPRIIHGKPVAVYNPNDKPFNELPVIYGFNNGGRPGWFDAVLIAEDGVCLGGHLCSHEAYMPGDLGILEGSRPDRHEGFRVHYPEGYRMDFVSHGDVSSHDGLKVAFERNAALAAKDGEAA